MIVLIQGPQSSISSTLILSNIQISPIVSPNGTPYSYADLIFQFSSSDLGKIEDASIDVMQYFRIVDRPGVPRAACANSATRAPPSQYSTTLIKCSSSVGFGQ